MAEVTAEQVASILTVVGKLKRVDFSEERQTLQPVSLGYDLDSQGRVDKKRYRVQPEGNVAATAPPSDQQVEKAKTTADAKTTVNPMDFLKELLKTHALLAVILFVLFTVAGVATAVPSIPWIGTMLLWIVIVAIVGTALAALVAFANGKVLSPVEAYYRAMAYANQQAAGSGSCLAYEPPPPALDWRGWTVWLICGSDKKRFGVSFTGKVVPFASGMN